MSCRAAALLPILIALCACAEGGSRGTGIFTEVAGNVESVLRTAPLDAPGARVADAALAPTAAELAGIRVAVDGTGAHARTDADGNFAVRGGFEGVITLVFQLPAGGGEARIDLNVPAGGTLTLQNVRVDATGGAATVETQAVAFDAVITAVNCDGRTLTLASTRHTPDDVDQYVLDLDTSSVRDPDGNLVPCAALSVGQRGSVQGFVNPDGSFGNATMDLKG